MIKIEDSKRIMKEAGLTEEKLQEYQNIIEPFFEFSTYICEKKNISQEEAEQLFNLYSKKYMIEKSADVKNLFGELKSDEEVAEKMYEITGEAVEKYALENNYDPEKSKILKDNIKDLMQFLKDNFSQEQ